jgi:hypothetical protein
VLKWSADPYRDADVMTDRAAAPPANGPASRPVAATALAWSSVFEQVRVYTQRGRHLVVPMNQLSSGGRIPAATGRLA